MKKAPFIFIFIFYSLGLVWGDHMPNLSLSFYMGSAFLLLVFCLLGYKYQRRWRPGALFFLLILSGAINITISKQIPPHHIVHWTNQILTMKGHLITDLNQRSGQYQTRLRVSALLEHNKLIPVCGTVLVFLDTSRSLPFQYGDEIILHGAVSSPRGQRNPGGFNAKNYWARRGIHTLILSRNLFWIQSTGSSRGNFIMKFIIYPVRRWMLRQIRRHHSRHTAPLFSALWVGYRYSLDSELLTSFAKSGTIHTLAVSGLHIGFLLFLFSFLLSRCHVPFFHRLPLIFFLLIFYCLLTEYRPAVLRASVMAMILLMGRALERRINLFNSLSCAAFIILIINPHDLFNAGFHLSFSAVGAIFIFYSVIQNHLPSIASSHPIAKKGIRLFSLSISAQLGTLPITSLHFHQISMIAPFTNLIAIPLTGVTYISELIAWILTPIHPIVSAIPEYLARGLIRLNQLCANIPFAFVNTNAFQSGLIAMGALLIIVIYLLQIRCKTRLYLAIVLLMANGFVWHPLFSKHTHQLKITQFDVGQGDAALLECPGGHTFLIDGGSEFASFNAGQRIIAPYLIQNGITRLHGVILTHPHQDHLGGLKYILQHFKVHALYLSDTTWTLPDFVRLKQIAHQNRCALQWVKTYKQLLPEGGIHITLLSSKSLLSHASALNNQSLLTSIQHGHFSILFMGDAERDVETQLIRNGLVKPHQIIKIGHHGSHTSTTSSFLQKLSPNAAIISVGQPNRFSHPGRNTITRLDSFQIKTYRTDRLGAVTILTNSDSFHISPDIFPSTP